MPAPFSSTTVGVVGLGLVGQAIAGRLLAAGFDVHGFDLRAEARAALQAMGGTARDSVRIVGATCPCVLLAVFDTKDVLTVLEQEDGLLAPGHCVRAVIDCSTGDPQALQALAARLHIELVWLPKQAPELSAMDQLWRDLKRVVAANRQAPTIEALSASALLWVLLLSPTQARRKAGMLSPHFWLRDL